MNALAKLFETGVRIGPANAAMRTLFTKTRKGRSAGPVANTKSPTASTRKAPKVATAEEKAEAREKAKKKRDEEIAKKRAATAETKRKANARKAAPKPVLKPTKNIVVKYIQEGKTIPEGFK